jgi:hypothetical protein
MYEMYDIVYEFNSKFSFHFIFSSIIMIIVIRKFQ